MKRVLLILFIFLHACSFFGQIGKTKLVSSNNIKFADTLHSIVTDSFVHDLGIISTRDTLLIKYFKYVGTDKDPVYITRTWTGDPFWISEYPKGVLKKGEIYSITICFLFSNRGNGNFEKAMGFYLTNGENIKFVFKGNVVKKEPQLFGQISSRDSSHIENIKSFLSTVLNSLNTKTRNDDSICKAFVPIDTLRERLKLNQTFCNVEKNNLIINYGFSENSHYSIDSICTRSIEKDIFYLRIKINYLFKDDYPIKKSENFYNWYKIWFDGKRYWLIPGHHHTDICIEFQWMPCNSKDYKRETAPWDPCWTPK